MTGENFSTKRQVCPNTTLPTQHPIWMTLESKPGLYSKKPFTEPPEPQRGQTCKLFISKIKVTKKKL